MNCLENHVGLKNCNSPEPTSGLYVNQLPGVTLESVQKITEAENQNFKSAWGEVRSRAWIRLENDLRIAFRKKYKLKTVRANAKLSGVVDESLTVSAAEKYRGPVIDLGDETNFLSIGIASFSIRLTGTISSLTIKIFDAEGAVLETITKLNAPAGKNVFSVGKKFLTSKIFLAVDTTTVQLYTSKLTTDDHNACCLCVKSICDGCMPAIYGGESTLVNPADVVESDNLFGFEVDYSVLCDYSSIVCRNKPEFTYSWLYLLGAELMQERLFSTRLNRFTTIDKETAAELRDYFSGEYQTALEESVNAIDVSEDDCCIVCNPIVYSKAILP